VTAETIMKHVRSLRGTFTMADVQSSVGGSPMTIRKGVQALVDDGTITRLGPMRNWTGRGRAPIVFEVR
jgi:DeoR/GlpR family transcriptional regulator of sugar metabolism